MKNLTDEEIALLEQYCNGTISEEDIEKLEDRLLTDAEFREEARTYFSMDAFLHMDENVPSVPETPVKTPKAPAPKPIIFWPVATAASLSFIAGIILYSLLISLENKGISAASTDQKTEMKASGFAVIEKAVNVQWETNSKAFENGQAVAQETLKIKKGIVHLEFFCGASVILEGPAEFDVKSSWEGFCRSGKLRANVPPAAHGFRIDTPSNRIVDLGTEFGLDISGNKESVVVFDGEIELHSKGKEMKLLKAGEGVKTEGSKQESIVATAAENFIKTSTLNDLHKGEIQNRYSQWLSQSKKWAADPNLIAYYNFTHENTPFVRNDGLNPQHNLDGKIIRAERVNGRWDEIENGGAMEFKKPGSRVRVNIPGEFTAFSFSTWVRIDSLDRQWNSLFMGDSYQIGEPHWQIFEDGRLVICVRVYDRPKDYHKIYYSPKIWEPSESGKWIHLATVYDPVKKEVKHFKNGQKIMHEVIEDKFHVTKLKIGPAEIGNWGQPTRTDPIFALRNINGRIDEMLLMDKALTDDEVMAIFKSGKRD